MTNAKTVERLENALVASFNREWGWSDDRNDPHALSLEQRLNTLDLVRRVCREHYRLAIADQRGPASTNDVT